MHKESIKLLLVDDDPGDRKMVKLALAQSFDIVDFNTETAETLSEATERLKNKDKDYDLVLLDLGLPDSQGIDTVQKAHNANPNVPIVVLTGLADEAKGLEAIEKGAEDYLVKGELLHRILVRVIRYAIARKIAKKKIEEAIEAKSQFMSMVSHELRVPLASIKESISIILDGATGRIKKIQRNYLDIAKRNIDRLNRLISELLDFQKLEAGKMKFVMQNNNANEIAKEVYDTMLSSAKEKGIDLVLELDNSLPRANFDKDRIIQVLSNLVNNAIKFTERGSVVIATRCYEDLIQVSVRDTGAGIQKEDIPRLFHKFEQIVTERRKAGTGLGLSISKEIIEKHNGKIWVESQPDQGSTFFFTLPKQKTDVVDNSQLAANTVHK